MTETTKQQELSRINTHLPSVTWMFIDNEWRVMCIWWLDHKVETITDKRYYTARGIPRVTYHERPRELEGEQFYGQGQKS